jgi:hypothetical protein
MTRRVFSITTADVTQKRRVKFLLLGGAILVLLAVVIVLLAVFIPRWAKGVRECHKRRFDLLFYFNKILRILEKNSFMQNNDIL